MISTKSTATCPEPQLEKDWFSALFAIAGILLLLALVVWRGTKYIVVTCLTKEYMPVNWVDIIFGITIIALFSGAGIYFIYRQYSIRVNQHGLYTPGFAKRTLKWGEIIEIEVTGRPNSRFNKIIFRSRENKIVLSPHIFKKPEELYSYAERYITWTQPDAPSLSQPQMRKLNWRRHT